MTAATNERSTSFETWRMHLFTLKQGFKAWKGAEVGLDVATGKVQPMGTIAGLRYIGTAVKTVDATAADTPVNVDLGQEIKVRWWANATTAPVTQIGVTAYAADDSTATSDDSKDPIGQVWAISALDGVAVEKSVPVDLGPPGAGTTGGVQSIPDFASGGSAPEEVASGGLYDVPATSAASSILLPADAEDGTQAWFSADGTKNAHAIVYRDGTGNVAITGALPAHKRHLVHVIKLGGTWRANADVSP